MSKETGGPAFPVEAKISSLGYRAEAHQTKTGNIFQFPGMTLRDYLAAQALSTAAGYPAEDVATWSADDFAMHAYNVADAMLKYRNK